MDPEKFLNLQMQMRENNMEVADFLNDFTSWKETVELKSKRLENSLKPEIPAIRNSLLKKNKKKPVKQKISDKKVERIKAYDYRAWDKFDVDKALAEDTDDGDNDNNNCTMDKTVDSSDQQIRNSSSETDEEQEDQRRIQLSKDARELGNVRFKEGRLDEAIEQYTMAIRLAPEDPTAYTNRAFAYIKTERYASAEADCIAALKLDQKSIKALFRRALARKGLGHISEAIEDLKELLKLNPDNKSALNELNSLTNTTTEGNTSAASTPSGPIQTSNNNKQRKMRKIPIIEVGGNVGSCNPSSQKTTHTDSTPQVLAKTCSSGIKEVVNGTESLGNPTVKMTNSSSSALKKFPFPTDKSVPSDSIKSSSQSAVNSTGDPNNPPKLPLSSSQSVNITKPPSNWFQLEREIRELCRSGSSSMSYSKKLNLTKEAVIYLCNIQPTSYQALFGENMDSDFLSRMLYAFCQCVEDHGDQSLSSSSPLVLTNHEITDRLLTLTKLSRFDVAWLMTDDVERVHAVKLIKHLQNDHSISKDIIKQICVQFECDE